MRVEQECYFCFIVCLLATYQMISKTQLSKRTVKKMNPHLVEIIMLAQKAGQLALAKKLSSPRSNHTTLNLDALNHIEEENVLVAGKVLGSGEMTQKKHIAALSFSAQAKEKLTKAGCEISTIAALLAKNKTLEGVKIL